MLDFISLFFGINSIEALLILTFVIGFNFKKYSFTDLFLSWTSITFLNYFITKYIQVPIPLFAQVLFVILSSLVMTVMLNIKFYKSLTLCFIVMFLIFGFTEIAMVRTYKSVFNIDFIECTNSEKFILFIPIRIVHVFTTYIIVRCFKYD